MTILTPRVRAIARALVLYASSDSTMFFKVVDAVLEFQHDADKRVTGLVLHQNGQNIPATKTR